MKGIGFAFAAVAIGASISVACAADLSYVATLRGQCSRLIFGGRDGTSACVQSVINDVHKDSRTGFTFTLGDLAVITFSGMGNRQIKDTPDKVTQPLDTVIFSLIGTGTPANSLKAVGLCTFGNPYNGASEIRCTAHTTQGLFEAHFVTDGGEPAIKKF